MGCWHYVLKLRNVLVGRVLLPLLFWRNDGVFVLEEKWDHLIVLDACRYDVFKEVIEESNINGKLEFRKSRGVTSQEFLLENFKGRSLKDTIYVTANPFAALLLAKEFYKIVHVWKVGWSNRYNTVPPSKVYECALQTHYTYPNKRLIIHFLQPHWPYLCEPQLASREARISMKQIKGLPLSKEEKELVERAFLQAGLLSLVDLPACFDLSLRKHLELYRKNLRIAIRWVKKILEFLHGRVVITSDHGEAFGENFPFFRVYGHKPKMRIPILTVVPWFVVEN